MNYSRDISDEDFDKLSKEKKKQYIAELLIKVSKALPVPPSLTPIAVVMAGVPGAGKTEFLDTLIENMQSNNIQDIFVRIDLDQIVTVYPDYTPENYAKFRSQANYALARAIDTSRNGRYNMMIDGTFAGQSEASINNIRRLLDAGYEVFMFYMYDEAATAWSYTKSREEETKRGIELEGFTNACRNVGINIKSVLTKFGSVDTFHMNAVIQKKLRDKDYEVTSDREQIDILINKGYNIDTLKETL